MPGGFYKVKASYYFAAVFMTKRIKKIIWPAFVAGNCLALLLGLLACLAPFVHAGHYPVIALLGLVFPLLYLANMALGGYWFYKRSRWRWASLAILILGIHQLSMVFGFRLAGKFEATKPAGSLRIVTWNLSSWGLTNRNNNNKMSFRNEMTELLNNTDADVICLQEYHFLRELSYRDSIIPELAKKGYVYSYFVRKKYTVHLYSTSHITGVAILSRIPITDTAYFHYAEADDTEPLVYADIKFNGQMVRIFTTHLQSVKFESYDYEALHNLKEPVNASVTQSRAVAWKLKHAYKKRAAQAEFLQQKIKESPYPVIVCGDFNDVPGSYTYCTVKDGLQDAFLKTGFGFGRTYRFLSPTLRIDYILAGKQLKVQQYKKFEVNYSDHYPIMADLSLAH